MRSRLTVMDEADDAPENRSIRASDAERAEVGNRLNAAVGEGRLTLDEFTRRVNRAYESTTRGELETLTSDLPAPDSVVPSAPGGTPTGKRRWKLAILGGSNFKGRWRVPARIGFFAFMGGSTIDLREAELSARAIEITLVSIMGGSDVIVPRGVRVVVDSTDILGGNDVKVDEKAVVADSPTVHIRTISIMGGNDVRHPKELRNSRR